MLPLRALSAVILAILVGVLSASVDAQSSRARPYAGPFFWLADQTETPGSRWVAPPTRATAPGGGSFSSFPDRLWVGDVVGAPPNDSCHAVGDRPATDYEVGPYGLQVVQYLGDWWRGLVYRPHTGTVGPATAYDFGYFDFAPRPGRPPTSRDGLPGTSVGNPGACVANALARLHGSLDGDGRWRTTTVDVPTGRDCLAASQIVLLRMNSELRCEPDLSDPDDHEFTSAFWRFLEGRSVPTGPTFFPSDYEAGAQWVRRVEVGFFALDGDSKGSGGTYELVPFGLPAYPTSGQPVGEYREYHPDSFGLVPDASLRNPLQAMDVNGVPTGEPIRFVDGRTGREDCLEWNVARPGERYDQDWACNRANSMAASNAAVESDGLRVVEAGPATPAEIEDSPPTIPLAHPRLHPFPAPAGSVWAEWNRAQMSCRWQYAVLTPLADQARERRDAWRGLYNRLAGGGGLDSTELAAFRRYAERRLGPGVAGPVAWAHGHWQGWEALLEYRIAAERQARGVLQAAGYRLVVGREFVVGVEHSGCVVDSLPSVQVDPVAPGQTTNGLWSRFFTFDVPEDTDTPEYWAPDGQLYHWRGTVTPRNAAAARGGRLPAGTVVREIAVGPTAYRHFSCGTVAEHLFGPDVAEITPDFTGVFDPDELLDEERGTYTRYEKGNFESFARSLRGVYARTTSGDVHEGRLITWDRDAIMRPTAYAVLDPRVSVNLELTVAVGAGVAEADYRVDVVRPYRWMRSTETYSGYAPGTEAGNPNPDLRADTEILETHGPLRLFGAMDVVRPGGCTLRLTSDPGDFPVPRGSVASTTLSRTSSA